MSLVDVWLTPVPDPLDASVLDAVRGRLDDGEAERLQRLRRPEDQLLFAAAHTLVRVLLSTLHPVRPSEWHLAADPDGKPRVAAPTTGPDLRFSLSHTAGMVGCAAAVGMPVGLDVEALARRLDAEALARRTLSGTELARWREGPDAGSKRGFLRYWTLKEALLKAVGRGLRTAPASVELSPARDGRATIRSLPAVFGEVSDWQAYSLEPLETHVAAVALGAGAAATVDVRRRIFALDEVLRAFPEAGA